MSDQNNYSSFAYAWGHLHSTHDWMSNSSTIDVLTLGELTLPGAHNSGIDKQSWYVPQVVAHWVVCQNNSFLDQLNNGARALDLRIVQETTGSYLFQHNGVNSKRTLNGLISALKTFLNANPDEFIVLDFHEMRSMASDLDQQAFVRIMMAELGERMIPAWNNRLTLAQLKKASAVQRLMVCTEISINRDYFNPRVWHAWAGTDQTTTGALHGFIRGVLQSPPAGERPWSLSATSYTYFEGPVDIKKKLNEWFDPALSDWATKCSIINADFFEESNLVLHCRRANVIKARARINAAATDEMGN